MRSRTFLGGFAAALLTTAMLSACGGTKAAPSIPVFTSTPVTAAAQGSPYSYTLAATDPAGQGITFALTTSPAGATLSGDSITWTPAPAQSRTSNSFTATATTTSGGSATQSWTVSPTGTVTVTSINTLWTSTGTTTINEVLPVEDAVLLNADGSVTVLPGTPTAPGVVSIPNVPAGYYWLVMGLNTNNLFGAYWTSASNFDAGRDIPGAAAPISSSTQTTTFDFNLSGLDGLTPADSVSFMTDNVVIPPIVFEPPAGATTLSAIVNTTYAPLNQFDWSQVNSAFLLQYQPASLGPLSLLTLGPEQTLTGLSLTDGATNAITATLNPGAPASVNINVPGSQWATLFDNAGPAAVTPISSWLSLSAEPYVTGINAPPALIGPNLYLALPTPVPTLGTSSDWLAGACAFNGLVPLASNQPPIITDQNLGTLAYEDPFPSGWTRSLMFCEQAAFMVPQTGSQNSFWPFMFVNGESVPISSSSVAPVVSQVQTPTINSASLFTVATINTTSVALSWSAPATGTPYGYSVIPFSVTPIANGVIFASAGTFGTAKTSITLPPLSAGKTYIFVIIAEADGKANMEQSPYRSMLPTGFAGIVSAPITISAGAASPAIHGDASILRRLSTPSPSQLQRGQKVTR